MQSKFIQESSFLDRCKLAREVFVCVTSLWPWCLLMVYCFIRQSRDNYDLLSTALYSAGKVENGGG